jgi:hypothetical protein
MTNAGSISAMNRRVILILLAVFGICFGLLLFLFNPSQYSFFPICIFHQVTGLHCPGCGAQRALHSLFHGQLLLALHYNPLFIIALPFLLLAGGRWIWQFASGRELPPILVRPLYIKIIAGVVIGFAVIRNIPVAPFTWLAPPG